MHSELYRRRLAAPEWQDLRRRMLQRANYRCQRCGAGRCVLQLHHKTYERLGQEHADDVEVLCPSCHKEADRERAAATTRRGYYARLDGWARKVYGDDWELYRDTDLVAERFDQWLDGRDE